MDEQELIRANRLRWIEALESGKYQQTVRRLRDNRGFCCLGVACDVLDSNGWTRMESVGAGVYFGNELTKLPTNIRLALGLKDQDPYLFGTAVKGGTYYYDAQSHTAREAIVGERVSASASWWNDEQGLSFAEIAAMLREQFKLPKETKDV